VHEIGAVGKAPLPQRDHGLGQQNLAAVRGTHNACRTVDRGAEEVAVARLRGAGVQAAPHLEWDAAVRADCGHPALQFERRRHCGGGIAEHGVQPIADHLHQLATVRLDRRPAEPVMAGERLGHPRGLGLPQTRAPLDVGEYESHRAGPQRSVGATRHWHGRKHRDRPNGGPHSEYRYGFAQQEPARLATGVPATQTTLAALVDHCLGQPHCRELGRRDNGLLLANSADAVVGTLE
jgi:hypothetical protein